MLDLNNPRHDPVASQREAVEAWDLVAQIHASLLPTSRDARSIRSTRRLAHSAEALASSLEPIQPRALKRLLQLNPQKRRQTIAEGLGLLAENVATLGADIELLTEAGRGRSLWILSRQADEEAAKALILLDLARTDQRDPTALKRQIGYFYDHLARCIYAEVTQMNPADFAEVRRMVDSMRPSHYLDGPNEVDWIFRNRLLANREEGLYVDYVNEDEGNRWITPATNDEIRFGGPSPAVRQLVGSLHRTGATSAAGLALLAEAWAEIDLEDSTHWQDLLAINHQFVTAVIDNDILTTAATQDDVDHVANHWGFPLSALDLTEVKVPRSALQAKQEAWSPY